MSDVHRWILKVEEINVLSGRAPRLKLRSCCLMVALEGPVWGLLREDPVAKNQSQSQTNTKRDVCNRRGIARTPIPSPIRAMILTQCSAVTCCLANIAKTIVKRTTFVCFWGLNSVIYKAALHMQLEFLFYLTCAGRYKEPNKWPI